MSPIRTTRRAALSVFLCIVFSSVAALANDGGTQTGSGGKTPPPPPGGGGASIVQPEPSGVGVWTDQLGDLLTRIRALFGG